MRASGGRPPRFIRAKQPSGGWTPGSYAILTLTLACSACGQSVADGNQGAPSQAARHLPAPAAPDATERLFLAGDGLELRDPRTGVLRPIPFGTSDRALRAQVDPIAGGIVDIWDGPPSDPTYEIHYRRDLGLNFCHGLFVGWDQGPVEGAYRTRSGIHSSMNREALLATGHVVLTRQQNVTPAYEDFSADSVQGSLGADGRVTDLNAGHVGCR